MDVLHHRVDERTENRLFGLGLFDLVYFPKFIFQGTVLVRV